MKGKGAKMFARRQERMEKFVVQGNLQSSENNRETETNYRFLPSYGKNFVNSGNDESTVEKNLDFQPNVYNNEIQTPEHESFVDHHRNVSKGFLQPGISLQQNETKYFDISHKNPLCDFQFYEEDSSTESENKFSKTIHDETEDSTVSQKPAFRSVKPPTIATNNLSPYTTNAQPFNFNFLPEAPQFKPNSKTSTKVWSSVKFDPTAKDILNSSS